MAVVALPLCKRPFQLRAAIRSRIQSEQALLEQRPPAERVMSLALLAATLLRAERCLVALSRYLLEAVEAVQQCLAADLEVLHLAAISILQDLLLLT